MNKNRMITLLLTMAFLLVPAGAAVAQDDSESMAESGGIPEANQDEALILYLGLRNALLAAGIAEGDLGAANAWLESEASNMSEADMDELLVGSMLADSDAETGDDEFGKAEEDEPELGDDEDDEDDDE